MRTCGFDFEYRWREEEQASGQSGSSYQIDFTRQCKPPYETHENIHSQLGHIPDKLEAQESVQFRTIPWYILAESGVYINWTEFSSQTAMI
jgi:hypothetical protein